MKRFNTIIISFGLAVTLIFACDTQKQPVSEAVNEVMTTDQVVYDSLNAQAYGADPYGMKKYVFAFLHAGPNRDQDSARAAELQNAHMQNMVRMAEAGQLVLAGPFLDDGDLRGIYIFNVKTVEEAEALTNTDPAIQAGRLKMELKEWYGSAALMAVNGLHKSLSRQSFAD
jgi:uncharacterized protein YciI